MSEDVLSTIYVFGFSSRKRKILRRFLPRTVFRFPSDACEVPASGTIMLWGRCELPDRLAQGVKIIRVEDGFLRSVGLGADLIHPVSWVFDRQGMYFDATQPSDLECLLEHAVFDEALRVRARCFREQIVQSGLTKYNVGVDRWKRPAGAQRVILVPGQVETDASLRYGAPGVRTNMELLREVRHANPTAYVVYKPHPDVLAGLRAHGVDESEAFRWSDEVVTDVSMARMIAEVDEVHLMTSLSGFEALLRGKSVTCYGQPFYAGWGLTKDVCPIPRRSRRLELDELVAGALLLYPAYVRRSNGMPCTPEEALADLVAWRDGAGGKVPLWRKAFRQVLRVTPGVR